MKLQFANKSSIIYNKIKCEVKLPQTTITKWNNY